MKNELRRRAEEKIIHLPPEKMDSFLPEETPRVLHELRVHQIELEMQNEELRASQSELDAAKTRYFDLYDLAPVGYCTISEEGLILEANLTALTLLGATRALLVNRPFSNFILKEDQDIYYLHRKQLFQSDEPQSFDLRMLKKDGTVFWARMEAAAAMDTSGATMCHVAISDIAGRKRMEAEKAKLEEQNRQLQKAESLGRMAGAIAHNFNNQLQTVMGNLEMSIGDLAVGQNPTGSLNEAMQAARKVTALMTSSLGFTVIQACDGVEAVEVFRQHKDKISCMICDLTMPRMNGWDTIAAIRAIRHDLPIILASGYDESSARAGVHSELPDFFLNKPYELDKLREAIGYAMARRK